MKGWETVANVRFVRRQSQADFIEFINHPSNAACNSSETGRQGGRQLVRCSFGFASTIFHEIGHAIGLIHEHQRSDRDDFVEVFLDRVLAGKESGFRKLRNTRNGPVYDFLSIMHYSETTFARDPSEPPIVRRDGGPLNNSAVPTAADAEFVETMYPHLGVVRRSDSSHGDPVEIRALSATKSSGNRLVTAVMDGSGKLRLIQWRTGFAGALTRPGADAQIGAGAVKSVDIAGSNVGSDLMATAVRSGSGHLLLISWRIVSNEWVRLADSGTQAGTASQIRIVRIDDSGLFVTACRTREGRLLLISWDLRNTQRIQRLADSGTQAGKISAVSIVKVRDTRGGHLVATTVVMPSRKLRTIVWRVSSSGERITRVGDSGNSMGAATHVDTVMTDSGHLLVSCRKLSGRRLKLITFAVSSTGRSVRRVADSGNLAGRIGANSVIVRPYGALSAVSTAEGNLKLIKWEITSSGRIRRLSDSSDQAGRISLVAPVLVDQTGPPPICTFVRAGDGHLFGITWDDQSTTGELQ